MEKVLSVGLLCAVFMGSSFAALAGDLTPEQAYCERDYDAFKKVALDPDQRVSFRNRGGLLEGGVCWWHSRFQRSATYLAIYRPELPKPSAAEARKLIRMLIKMQGPVVIPGYSGLRDFSSDFEAVLQKQLERWQLSDGVWRSAWVNGLSGHTHERSKKLRKMMDDLYVAVVDKKMIVWEKLQVPGIPAHAWLVVDMEKLEHGYRLKTIDSNYPTETVSYDYQFGDTHLVIYKVLDFVPYRGADRDLKKIFGAFSAFCGHAPGAAIETPAGSEPSSASE